MIQHLGAILLIAVQLAICAFYAVFVVASVVMAINVVLERLHRLLARITGGERISAVMAAGLSAHSASVAIPIRYTRGAS
jgi:hypothetical protein